MTNTLAFAIRQSGAGPIFVGSYEFNDPIEQWEPESGNVVTLYRAGVCIQARILTASTRSYTGEVIGFDNDVGDGCEDTKIGDVVAFTFDNIFGCSR
jgi:hypothetical protein